ncbi:hypothetical protein, partial [Mycobacterium marinum]|uniref:hypothetical protein n=1 Tax=Mycobacterium marinum TaxID=1781 RepID=UPI0021C32777
GPQFLIDTTNTGWILLSGQNWIPLLGHQWVLFHGHGQLFGCCWFMIVCELKVGDEFFVSRFDCVAA